MHRPTSRAGATLGPGTGVRLRFAHAVQRVLSSIVSASRASGVTRAEGKTTTYAVRPFLGAPPVAQSSAPVVPGFVPANGDDDAMRARARRALAEARASMPTLLNDDEDTPPPDLAHLPGEAAGLRRALRSYTDHVDRLLAEAAEERRLLLTKIGLLTEDVLHLRAELARVKQGLPTLAGSSSTGLAIGSAPEMLVAATPMHEAVTRQEDTGGDSATASERTPEPSDDTDKAGTATAFDTGAATVSSDGGYPAADLGLPGSDMAQPAAALDRSDPTGGEVTDQEPAATTSESHSPVESGPALTRRIFPAGTVGVLLAVRPIDSFLQLATLQERFAAHAGIDHTELSSYESGEARIRLSFRRAMPWDGLRAALEDVIGSPVDPALVEYAGGVLRVRLPELPAAPVLGANGAG